MSVADTVRSTIKAQGMSLNELANRLGWSAQNLSNKMQRANFSEAEIRAIAAALGAEAEIAFQFPDDKPQVDNTMGPFVVVSDRRHLVIPGMTAENDLYVLRWMYDGDYTADYSAGKLRLNGIVCDLQGKRPHLLRVKYIPGVGDPIIDYISNGILLSETTEHIKLLQTAAKAAELAIEFMQPYIQSVDNP